MGMQNGIINLKNGLAVSYKNIHSAHDSASLLLGIYPREIKTYIQTKPIYELLQQLYP